MNHKKSRANKYGSDVAILAGDVQHGWAISLLTTELTLLGVSSEVVLHLIGLLENRIIRTLVDGEMLDVNYGLYYSIDDLSEEQILDMLWSKTGVLYEFCGIAGALIAKNKVVYDDETVSLQNFCSLCGTAFQIRDDILGIVGSKEILGKPVGADIREGKKTLIIKEALSRADNNEREVILNALGNQAATEVEIQSAIDQIVGLGGIEKARIVANQFVNKALPYLDNIPESESKNLLLNWAQYLIDRKL